MATARCSCRAGRQSRRRRDAAGRLEVRRRLCRSRHRDHRGRTRTRARRTRPAGRRPHRSCSKSSGRWCSHTRRVATPDRGLSSASCHRHAPRISIPPTGRGHGARLGSGHAGASKPPSRRSLTVGDRAKDRRQPAGRLGRFRSWCRWSDPLLGWLPPALGSGPGGSSYDLSSRFGCSAPRLCGRGVSLVRGVAPTPLSRAPPARSVQQGRAWRCTRGEPARPRPSGSDRCASRVP